MKQGFAAPQNLGPMQNAIFLSTRKTLRPARYSKIVQDIFQLSAIKSRPATPIEEWFNYSNIDASNKKRKSGEAILAEGTGKSLDFVKVEKKIRFS